MTTFGKFEVIVSDDGRWEKGSVVPIVINGDGTVNEIAEGDLPPVVGANPDHNPAPEAPAETESEAPPAEGEAPGPETSVGP